MCVCVYPFDCVGFVLFLNIQVILSVKKSKEQEYAQMIPKLLEEYNAGYIF